MKRLRLGWRRCGLTYGFVVTKLGEDTCNDPDAQQYPPHMMQYLLDGKIREHPDADPIDAWADDARAKLTNTEGNI